MARLILTRGLPASGKTYWATQWVLQDSTRRRMINRDRIRFALYGAHTGLSVDEEEYVVTVEHEQVGYLLAHGYDVVVDDSNLSPYRVDDLRDLAVQHGALVEIHEMPTSVDDCVRRDFARSLRGEPHVGGDVIREMDAATSRALHLPRPRTSEQQSERVPA